MKITNNNKGFSLVELLIALLIMAVIAAIAIGLFGGILDTSRGSADRETAETIRKAILTYINSTGDAELAILNSGTPSPSAILTRLACSINIQGTGASKTATLTDANGNEVGNLSTTTSGSPILTGKVGPFLDSTKNLMPQQNGYKDWVIEVNSISQRVSVTSTQGSINAITVNLNK